MKFPTYSITKRLTNKHKNTKLDEKIENISHVTNPRRMLNSALLTCTASLIMYGPHINGWISTQKPRRPWFLYVLFLFFIPWRTAMQHQLCDLTPAHVKPCFANVHYFVQWSCMYGNGPHFWWISINNPRRPCFLCTMKELPTSVYVTWLSTGAR